MMVAEQKELSCFGRIALLLEQKIGFWEVLVVRWVLAPAVRHVMVCPEIMRFGRRLHRRLRADRLAVISKSNPLRLPVCSCENIDGTSTCGPQPIIAGRSR